MTHKSHILIVDDDTRILKLLKQFLRQNNYFVSTSISTIEAEDMIQNFVFDLIILDVMMPGITGTEFAQKIRNNGSKIPIVMLTALSEPQDRVKGLESGANDYIAKPFEPKELLLRIQNLINAYIEINAIRESIRFGQCKYNTLTKEFKINEEEITLSSTEQKLLDIMVASRNKPISRESLCKIMGDLNPRSIDVQIVRLRSKIEAEPKKPKSLKTIRNQGYVLYTN